MPELRDKVVVITGGSAGIGRALAEAFGVEGMKVAVIARGEMKLHSTEDDLIARGIRVLAYQADVASMEDLQSVARQIEIDLGPIYLWINNAMTSVFSPIKEMSAEEVKRTTDVVYLGSVYGTMVALKKMLPRDEGHILQIGSALAYQSIPLQSAYCGAKHGVRGFLQSLRIELKHDRSKVKLTELHLPAVNTPQFEWVDNHLDQHPMPVPPIFQPEVVARAAVFLAKNPRREMWLAGSTIKAIFAAKFAPRIAEWYLARYGYESQFSENLKPTGDNALWEPVAKDYGAHGSFDGIARKRSYLLELNMRRKSLVSFVLASSALAFMFWPKRLRT